MKKFKILDSYRCVKTSEYVDFNEMLKYEHNAYQFHYQSIQRLNERGGLSYQEMIAVITGILDRSVVPIDQARAKLSRLIQIYTD